MFENSNCEITVLSVERTFWEKATILHDLRHRPDSYKTADRISLHCYDFFKLAKTGISVKPIKNLIYLKV